MFSYMRAVFRMLRARLAASRYDAFNIEDYFRSIGVRIGHGNRIYLRSIGGEPWLVTIGNHCTIAAGVAFITHDGASWIFTDEYPSLQKYGTIEIKDNCFIGYRSIIMPNVTIGPNSIVGAGAVVTKDVPPDTIVGGNPARVICSIHDYKKKLLAVWATQKPPGYLDELIPGERYAPKYINSLKLANRGKLRSHLVKLFYGE